MRPRLFFAWYKQVSWDRFNQNCICAVTSTVAYYVLRSELIGLNGRQKRECLTGEQESALEAAKKRKRKWNLNASGRKMTGGQ